MAKVIHNSVEVLIGTADSDTRAKKSSSKSKDVAPINKKSKKKPGLVSPKKARLPDLPVSVGKTSITKKKKRKRVTIKHSTVKMEKPSPNTLENSTATEESVIDSHDVSNETTNEENGSSIDTNSNGDNINTTKPDKETVITTSTTTAITSKTPKKVPVTNPKQEKKNEKPLPDGGMKTIRKKDKNKKKQKNEKIKSQIKQKDSDISKSKKKIKNTEKLLLERAMMQKMRRTPRRKSKVDKRIRELQRSVDPVLQKKPFERLIRCVAELLTSRYDFIRVKKSYMLGLQEYIESRIISILLEARELTLHRGCKTTNISDLNLAYKRITGKIIPHRI